MQPDLAFILRLVPLAQRFGQLRGKLPGIYLECQGTNKDEDKEMLKNKKPIQQREPHLPFFLHRDGARNSNDRCPVY